MAEEKKTRRRRKVQEEKPAEVAEAIKEVTEAEPVQETKQEESKKAEVNEELELLREQNRLMKAQMEELKAQISNTRPQVIQLAPDTERVEFLWIAPVADENELLIAGGLYGKITGKVGNFSVPKNELSRMMDAEMRKYIETRWLIVLGGMTEGERKMYGVDYKPGEVLDKEVFLGMLNLKKEIVDIYRDLCDDSKDVVAKMYYEAWLDPNKRSKINRSIVVEMNKIASKPGLKAIIEEMNRAEAE